MPWPALQMDGMRAGYNARIDAEEARSAAASSRGSWRRLRLPRLGRRAFLFMSAIGDLDSVREALASEEEVAGGYVGEAQAVRRDRRAGPVQVGGRAGAEPAPGT